MKDYKNFENSLKKLIRSCNEVMKISFPKSNYINGQKDQCRLIGTDTFSFSNQYLPDYFSTSSYVRHSLLRTKEMRDFVESLNGNKIIKQHLNISFGNKYFVTNLSTQRLVQDILLKYLSTKKGFLVDSALIERIYVSLMNHYRKSYVSTVLVTYLENVKFQNKNMIMDVNKRICNLTSYEKVKLFNSNKNFRQFYTGAWRSNVNFRKINSYIEISLKDKKVFSSKCQKEEINVHLQDIDHILNIIRLFTNSKINRSPIILKMKFLPFSDYEEVRGENAFLDYIEFVNFNSKFHYWFRTTYKKHNNAIQSFPALKFIFDRLSYANNRYLEEDIIIDSCIALESIVKGCLSKNKGFRTTAHNVGLYVADLLGENKDDKKLIYNDIKKCYNRRNKIMHGDTTNILSDSTTFILYYYLRISIRKIIDNSNNLTKKDLIDLLF